MILRDLLPDFPRETRAGVECVLVPTDYWFSGSGWPGGEVHPAACARLRAWLEMWRYRGGMVTMVCEDNEGVPWHRYFAVHAGLWEAFTSRAALREDQMEDDA